MRGTGDQDGEEGGGRRSARAAPCVREAALRALGLPGSLARALKTTPALSVCLNRPPITVARPLAAAATIEVDGSREVLLSVVVVSLTLVCCCFSFTLYYSQKKAKKRSLFRHLLSQSKQNPAAPAARRSDQIRSQSVLSEVAARDLLLEVLDVLDELLAAVLEEQVAVHEPRGVAWFATRF